MTTPLPGDLEKAREIVALISPRVKSAPEVIASALAQARAEERERAARIAEDEDAIEAARDIGGPLAQIEISTRREIAEAIRREDAP
jgi:hypothetical protein